MKKIFSKLSMVGMLNAFALMLVVHSASATCWWNIYQPEVPEGVKRLSK